MKTNLNKKSGLLSNADYSIRIEYLHNGEVKIKSVEFSTKAATVAVH